MSTAEKIIARASHRFRAPVSRGAKPKVDRTGGDSGFGIIRGVSIVSEGEALGHRMWLDTEFVESVHKSVNASKKGVKMRFTHPSLSGDGLGSFLGRAKASKMTNGKAFADIHFAEASHNTPDGDLATYVMDLAEEDPEAFGVSIVFEQDIGARDRFISQHTDEDGQFKSPDKRNSKNYRHARLSQLWAADVVDEPAANPDGLFHRNQEIADEADQLCAFALGLTEQRPTLAHLSVDADRLAGFASRFLESHGLELKEKPMSSENKGEAAGLTKADLDSFSTTLLGAVDAKLTAFRKELAPEKKEGEPTAEELLKQGAKRASEIMAFASTSGLNDHAKIAQEAIDGGMTVESFKASLADRLVAQNKLSKDDGSGGNENDPHAKFRAEFKAGKVEFAKVGIIDEDAYVRSRCRDEGLEVPEIKKAG